MSTIKIYIYYLDHPDNWAQPPLSSTVIRLRKQQNTDHMPQISLCGGGTTLYCQHANKATESELCSFFPSCLVVLLFNATKIQSSKTVTMRHRPHFAAVAPLFTVSMLSRHHCSSFFVFFFTAPNTDCSFYTVQHTSLHGHHANEATEHRHQSGNPELQGTYQHTSKKDRGGSQSWGHFALFAKHSIRTLVLSLLVKGGKEMAWPSASSRQGNSSLSTNRSRYLEQTSQHFYIHGTDHGASTQYDASCGSGKFLSVTISSIYIYIHYIQETDQNQHAVLFIIFRLICIMCVLRVLMSTW